MADIGFRCLFICFVMPMELRLVICFVISMGLLLVVCVVRLMVCHIRGIILVVCFVITEDLQRTSCSLFYSVHR